MADVAWRARAHELLREVVAIARSVPSDDPGGWIGNALARADAPAVTRYATGTGVLSLDPFAALRPTADVWVIAPVSSGTATVGLDADGSMVAGTSSFGPDDEDEPQAVGLRLSDGTPVLVTHDNGWSFAVQAAAILDDGAQLWLLAEWNGDDGAAAGVAELRVSLLDPEIGGVRGRRVVHAIADTGRTASVTVEYELVGVDAAGGPAACWVAQDEEDLDFEEDTEQVSGIADDAALLDRAIDRLAGAEAVETPVLRWSARLHGTPPALPEGDTAVEDAAQAMLGTIRRAVAAIDLPAPCALELAWSYDDESRSGPLPGLLVVDRAFADAFRTVPSGRSAAYELRRAPEPGEGREVHLVDHADDATLDAWLPLRWVGCGTDDDPSALRRLALVRRRLLDLLLEASWQTPWSAPVLPWLAFGPRGLDGAPLGGHGVDPWSEIR